VAIGGAAALYVARWRRAREEAGSRAASGWRLVAFLAGLAAAFAALVSPVDRLGEQLLVMHMTQHLLLLDVASVLLILGLTKVILRPATRRLTRIERAAGPLAHPAFAVVAYAGTMAAWHVPAAYDAALEHPALHVLEHVCFASAGLLYWWHLLSPIRARHRLGGLGPIAYMATTKVLVGLLGIVITFSPDLLYDFYAGRSGVWRLSALTDQNMAGALMALEQSLIMGAALAYLFIRMLIESEREEQRAERFESEREEQRAERFESEREEPGTEHTERTGSERGEQRTEPLGTNLNPVR
jgi:cytochrome c oxidase assembly factor CtaG